MGFNAFNYWKRGKKVVPMLKKAPKNSPHPLVWHQIKKGCYDLSPYWGMIKFELKLFEKEMYDYIKKNPRVSKEDIEAFRMKRRPIYNKRISKLAEEHTEYEGKRLKLLKNQLIKDFGVDVWDEALNACPDTGDLMDLYNTYEKLKLNYDG